MTEQAVATITGAHPVALITGGADGIGWAIVRRFAAAGCQVAIADIREDVAMDRAQKLGADHLAIAADVASEAAVCAMVAKAIERFGRLDVLVNNAGVADSLLPTTEQSGEAFGRLLDIHLKGTFLASREAARVMLRQRAGAIVNISSIAGLAGLPRRNAYGAAKAGIISLTRSMACEWACSGVRVNAVAPGYVRTALVEELERTGRLDTSALKRRTPMGRLAQPMEIAEAVWFLASPQASYITGAVLSVDGGWHAFGAAGDASSGAAIWSRPSPRSSSRCSTFDAT